MPFDLWTAIIAACFCITLGIFAFIKDPKSRANRSFAFFNLTLAAWVPTDLIKYISNHQTALTMYRLSYIGGSFITFAFIVFMWTIAEYKPSWMYRLTKWSAMAFAVLSQTNLMIRDIKFNIVESAPISETHGPAYLFFTLFFVASLIYSFKPFVFDFAKSSGTKRKQLQYILFAFFLGCIAVVNFFANQANNKIPALFYLFLMGISTTFAVAIMKHRLMDITVIIRKTLVYSVVMGALAAAYVATITLSAKLFQGYAGFQNFFSPALVAFLFA